MQQVSRAFFSAGDILCATFYKKCAEHDFFVAYKKIIWSVARHICDLWVAACTAGATQAVVAECYALGFSPVFTLGILTLCQRCVIVFA